MYSKIFSKIKPVFTQIFLSILVLVSFSSFLSINTNAQTLETFNFTGFNSMFCVSDSGDCKGLFNAFIDFLISIAPVFAILVMVWGGYLYFIAGASGDSNSKGLSAIRNGVIGLLIVLTARVFIRDGIFVGFTEGGLEPQAIVNGLAVFINENIIDTLITLSSVIAILVIIWGGYKYFFGAFGGQEDGANAIKNGFIGLIVALITRPLVTAIFSLGGDSTIDPNAFESGQTTWAQSFAGFAVGFLNNIVIPLSSIFALFMLISAGYKWITSGGQQYAGEEALRMVRNAVLGLVLVLLSFSIVQVVIFFIPIS